MMHDFRCVNADDMNYSVLADRVRYFKESEGGREAVCKVMEDMRNSVAEESDYKARARVVSSLWLQGIKDIDLIAKVTEFTTDQVKNILGSRYAEA